MLSSWQNELDQIVDRRYSQLVALRRRLHAHPEPSDEERETSLHLYQLLGDAGFRVEMGPEGRGVIADLRSSTAGGTTSPDLSVPRLALRADIDALRIHDAKTVDYRSQRDGVMHACGHDAHTAVVAGALLALTDLDHAGRLPWPVPVRGIFQPAEETAEGARQMIAVGALDNVRSVLALHCDPSRAVGRIGVRAGTFTANCDGMRITVVGRGGHAARPHEACDPIAAAAQLISTLYLHIPRVTDSQDAVVVTIGQVQGGDNSNVIPEQVLLRGTIRTLDARVRQQTFDHIRRLAHGISVTSDTRIEVHFEVGPDSIHNDPQWVDLFRRVGRELLGIAGVDEIPRPSMGSEDFAYYLEQVPGAMIRLGCASEKAGSAPLHAPTFDVDEEAIRLGAKILARAAIYGCEPHGAGFQPANSAPPKEPREC